MLIVVNGIVICLFFWGCHVNTVQSQICDSRLEPVENPTIAYKQRGRDQSTRCEGFYRRPVAVEELIIVSVVKGYFQFKWLKTEKIEVSAPSFEKPINVRAVGIKSRTYYRMDAKISPAQKQIWPVKEVIFKKKGLYNNIGIFGWIKTGTDKKYVPVIASGRMDSTNQDDNIRLSFIANTDRGYQ